MNTGQSELVLPRWASPAPEPGRWQPEPDRNREAALGGEAAGAVLCF